MFSHKNLKYNQNRNKPKKTHLTIETKKISFEIISNFACGTSSTFETFLALQYKCILITSYRTSPVAHSDIALDVEGRCPREPEGLHVRVDHRLVHGAVHAPRALGKQ